MKGRDDSTFRAYVKLGGKRIYHGCYSTADDAARVVDA